jgi:hypothetical protein
VARLVKSKIAGPVCSGTAELNRILLLGSRGPAVAETGLAPSVCLSLVPSIIRCQGVFRETVPPRSGVWYVLTVFWEALHGQEVVRGQPGL